MAEFRILLNKLCRSGFRKNSEGLNQAPETVIPMTQKASSGAGKEKARQRFLDSGAVSVFGAKQFRMQQHRANHDGGAKIGGPVEKIDSGVAGHIRRLIQAEEAHLLLPLQHSGRFA